MKFHTKHLKPHHILTWLRKQPRHMQHLYALTAAGSITALIGIAILYFDYGLWQERYDRRETVPVTTVTPEKTSDIEPPSPKTMINSFLDEVGAQLKDLKTKKDSLLEGKETYTHEEPTQSKRASEWEVSQ
jgi:hypothetical protein